jgi:hypothetical protein
MSWKWYGVRTVFRSVPSGRPQGTDGDFSANVTLVEDRVVIIRARSFKEAIHKGEREAKAYAAASPHRNPYGQLVQQRYLGYCDAYELFDEPGVSIEVFSTTEVVAKTESDSRVIDRLIGSKDSDVTSNSPQRTVCCAPPLSSSVRFIERPPNAPSKPVPSQRSMDRF